MARGSMPELESKSKSKNLYPVDEDDEAEEIPTKSKKSQEENKKDIVETLVSINN